MINIFNMNRIYSLLLKYFKNYNFLGKGVTFHYTCDISKGAEAYIYLGNYVSLAKDVWLNIPFEARNLKERSPIIKIGDGTSLGRRCTISGIRKIEIGSKVLFGPGVFITDHSHEFKHLSIPIMEQGVTEGGSIIVEDGCWFGYNSVIVAHRGREIRIGRNSVIGANAVVTKSCPPNSVLVGIPAQNIKQETLP